MKKSRQFTLLSLLVFLLATTVAAQIVIINVDGVKDVDEGYTQVALQDTQTQFGDNNDDSADSANGSELDGMYMVDQGDSFYIFLTGNVETNFNKLEIFFDTVAGGQNVLRNDNVDVDFNALNTMAGLTFDAVFEADYYVTITLGDGDDEDSQIETYANYATLPTAGGGTGMFIGGGNGTTITGTDIEIGVNNSNTAGVEDGTGTTTNDPSTVTTGVEMRIAKSALGLGTGARADDVKATAFINGSGHDFLSNQVLGSIGGGANLGNPANVDFSAIVGNQFVQVQVPTSVTLTSQNSTSMTVVWVWAALGLMLMTGVAVRRKS